MITIQKDSEADQAASVYAMQLSTDTTDEMRLKAAFLAGAAFAFGKAAQITNEVFNAKRI